MKKVIGILALVALVGNIANAELLKNFKYDGQIEVNAYQVKDADYDADTTDKENDTNTRVQVNMGFELNDDVDAVVSAVKCDRQYGNASQSAEDVTDLFKFEQAYINLKGVLGLDHKLGRQYYGNEGDLIVYYGPQSWPYNYGGFSANGLSVTGLDGWSSSHKMMSDKLTLGAILAKDTNETATSGAPANGVAPDTDEDIFGLTAGYDLMENLKLGGYFYQYNTQSGDVAGPNDRLQVFGAKADGKFMGFTYHGEVAKNMGKNNRNINGLGGMTTNDYTGMGFLANAKYDLDLVGKWTFMGEYARGTGDDDTAATDDESAAFYGINSDYRPGIIWGGDFLGLTSNGISNLTTWNVAAKWNTPMFEKLTLSGKLLHFSPTEEVTGVNGYDTYGNELDLCALWQHSENVGVKAYYAMFMPDEDYAATLTTPDSDDSTMVIGAAFNVKF